MNPWAHKFYEPTAAQILWAQSPTNFMRLRLCKSYEPKTPEILWAQSPINFKNPRPHKSYEPKVPKNLWAQGTHNSLPAGTYQSEPGSGTLSK